MLASHCIAVSPLRSFRLFFVINKAYYHHGSKNIDPFNDKNWIVKRPKFLNLPKNEHSKLDTFEFKFSKGENGNVYLQDSSFKDNLDKAMQFIYNEKLTSLDAEQVPIKNLAWLKLRDSIYSQLKHTSKQPPAYVPPLSELIHLSCPSNLIPLLMNCNKVNNSIWKAILKNGQSNDVSTLDKFIYILQQTFDHTYEQEILPMMTNTDDTDGAHNVDITNPAEWFSEARKIRRHIIMHIGPTNSGKTYRALQKLKSVDRGYYAGPLRLLAREVYDRFQNEKVRCNLLTGEEVIRDLDDKGNPAGLTSGTVEMVPINQKFDVVVLDEIQMMSDLDRGWAWTNALLGVVSKEVHLCGEKSVLPLIKNIVKMTGDKLTINEYERLGKLTVEDSPVKDGIKGLRKGDCVVAFSKKKILDLKLKIEKDTNLKVAVIYGSLPPETRVQQASLFNSGNYDIMVASDAIGMGLNLSIDRVVFTTNMKYNGEELAEMTSSQIKQIGGRAGRFKSTSASGDVPQGFITGFESKVLKSVRKAIESPVEYLKTAVTWPTDEICAQLMTQFPPGTPASTLLQTIADELEKSSNKLFTLSDLKNKLKIIALFEHMEDIPFLDKLKLSNAPVKDMPMVTKAFTKFCETIAKRHTRGLLSYRLPFNLLDYKCIPSESYSLEVYESLYNIITLYFWLSNRYPNYFIDMESAKDMKYFCEMIIFEKLDRLKKNPYARKPYASTRDQWPPSGRRVHT
ncbi:ATP-dependent RNA helicase SUV3 [Saccharomyces eubayanus]|uniref:ATP-dependent RNA helicase SUV3 n=1 Tax=Saccharomyces eubayanus TaxID=1080349 RepID=UPI0006C2BDC2|nr:SUV3-like protein [Saccharomyces eubayanus]KOG96278.1 SUV3-like protein [Saccharomyces eubayanus]